jgi:plasmid stabilization system protein ParE
VRIRFTATARTEFLAAIEYIRKDKPGAAVQFRRKAEKALRRLNRFPDSGRKLPELPDLPFREVVVTPYRFFYRVEQKTVWIVAVWHGAQQPDEP